MGRIDHIQFAVTVSQVGPVVRVHAADGYGCCHMNFWNLGGRRVRYRFNCSGLHYTALLPTTLLAALHCLLHYATLYYTALHRTSIRFTVKPTTPQ